MVNTFATTMVPIWVVESKLMLSGKSDTRISSSIHSNNTTFLMEQLGGYSSLGSRIKLMECWIVSRIWKRSYAIYR